MTTRNEEEKIPQAAIDGLENNDVIKKQFCDNENQANPSKEFENENHLDITSASQGSVGREVDMENEDLEEDEPNWGAISLHEPAKTDAPIFLSARDSRNAAFSRFSTALDECHASLKHSVDELLSTAANIHHVQSEKLDELEIEIKQYFVGNEEEREIMHRKLEESASAAQGLFSQLLMRVSQPLSDARGELSVLLDKKRLGDGEVEDISNRKRPPAISEAGNDKRRCNLPHH